MASRGHRGDLTRRLGAAFTAWLCLQGAFVLHLLRGNGEGAIEIRQALFSRAVSDVASLNGTPAQIEAMGFVAGPQHAAGQAAGAPPRDARVANTHPVDVVETAKRLVLEFSVGGGMTCGDFAGPLSRKPDWLAAANGCCSDHTEVFLARSAREGLMAREVGNAAHSMVEVFDTDRSAWVMVDPMGALLARDPAGRPLSASEIRARLLSAAPVRWEMFGHGWRHPADTTAPWFLSTYGRGASRRTVWADLFWTWGNDVGRQDRLREALARPPKSVTQLVGLLIGVQPSYVYLDDREAAPRLRDLRRVRTWVIADLVVGGVLGAALGVALLRRRRVAATTRTTTRSRSAARRLGQPQPG